LLKTFNFKKGLLLAGDTSSKTSDPLDRRVWPLFGDAGSATLVCNDRSNSKMSFEFCTDGSRYKAIIKPQSGYKKMETSETPFLKLDSIGIFNFTMKEVPESIKRVLEKNEIEIDRVDIFALHQANKVINETIGKKLKLRNEQLLSSISDYGNTSSASIPMTLTANLQSFEQNQKIILSGFGVGLSWATVLIQNMNIKILPIQDF
jgi:3-oxoacyl-[acyl-carrier-protein] synthase-3